mmetsp:Transcript_1067/g.1783  ORF Transcript_1067/g.1783 Transcript_1067/m.1783 type:complete len:116 (+) Transcript_1067:247-594(+)
MGGAQALHTVFGDEELASNLAGVFALSTFLSHDSELPGRIKSQVASGKRIPPLLYCHGTADPMIRLAWGEETSERLRDAGAQVEFRTYAGLEHALSQEELRHVNAWAESRLSEVA